MKKFLLSLAILATGFGIANAETVTIDGSDTNVELAGTKLTSGNYQPLTSASLSGVTLTFAENGASTKPAWYANSKDFRVYAKSSVKVTVPAGATISEITFTFTSTWGANNYSNLTVSSGSITPTFTATNKPTNGATIVWSGSATDVTFTVPATKDSWMSANPQFRFAKCVVTYSTGGGPVAPSAPVISGETTFYGDNTTVTMTAAAGADIYYTMSATTPADPTTSSLKYTNEIVINSTTTFKAIAVKDGLTSPVATKTFTKGEVENVANIAEFLTKAKGTVCRFANPVTVMGLYDKRYMFVEDATGALQIFATNNQLDRPYQMGQTISGFVGSADVYNNNPQLAVADFISTFPATASGTAREIKPKIIEPTLEAVQANLNRYVVVTGSVTKTGNNYFVGPVQLYKRFNSISALPSDIEGQNKDVAGYAVIFNTTPELYFTEVGAPNTLNVNSLEMTNAPIYGAQGYVVAPEGAVVYNMSGARVANSGLAAGIYLVRYNGVTTKVVVR